MTKTAIIFYIDDGSICATTYKSNEDYAPKEWTDGVVTELTIYENGVEINYNALHLNKKFARGYYRFEQEEEKNNEIL